MYTEILLIGPVEPLQYWLTHVLIAQVWIKQKPKKSKAVRRYSNVLNEFISPQ